MNHNYKFVHAYIEANFPECKFIGLSDYGELFIELTIQDESRIQEICGFIRGNFKAEVSKITLVEKLDIETAETMIEELNKLMEENTSPPPPKDLLKIGRF